MKTTILTALVLLLSFGLAAQEAVFKDVKGKVEYQLAGKAWSPAKVGDSIPAGTLVSTGFKSTASLSVLGSLISLKPLTRLSLDELVKSETGTKTSLKLLSGKVKAEVRPKTAANDQEFEVKGPNATASVRGTGLDTDGESILVNHGEVEFTNNFGINRSVQGGEFTTSGSGPSVSPPVSVKPAAAPALKDDGTVDEEKVTEQDNQEAENGTTVDLETVSNDFGDQVDTTDTGPSFTEVLDEVVSEVVSDVVEQTNVAVSADLTVTIQ
ncbi:MAG: FecR domain-containing protein [Spirochaetales bacterium]